MDLRAEILDVLDNPARVWDAVLTNLATEPRVTLLVLTTCKTPVTLVEWQESLARVSMEAAVKFESSLRILDDSFIRTDRFNNTHHAQFRNPSMDDFCASYLDRNVGVATRVAAREPTLGQVSRLIELGTVLEPIRIPYDGFRKKKFSSIYEALISEPTLLLQRLLEIMPDDSRMTLAVYSSALNLLTLISEAKNISDKAMLTVRARLTPTVMPLKFGDLVDGFLFATLDDPGRARALAKVLGPDFESLYSQLAASAITLKHFDSLVNVDIALERDGTNAQWATRFEQLSAGWLDAEGSSSELISSRDIYARISDHLEIDEWARLRQWDEMINIAEDGEAQAELDAQKDARAEADAASEWSSGSQDSDVNTNDDVEELEIDTMFASLNFSKGE